MTKQYKETLQYVLDNGVMRGDRTGKGRHSVFSPPDEIYDLSLGFPLVTLREIKPKAMIDELLWFISGSTDVNDLKYKFFWEKWVPNEHHAGTYAECTGRENVAALSAEEKARVGTIGNLYGVSWRNAPGPKGQILPIRKMEDLPKALIEKFVDIDDEGKAKTSVSDLIAYLDEPSTGDTDINEFEMKASIRGAILKSYWENFDQLNELVYKIKNTPYSSRLRVSAYLTDYMAFEEFSPQLNTMDGRACLTPCHTFFQCYVHNGEDDKPSTLDLKLTLTSSDVPVGRIYNIAQYALLCEMLAQVCGLRAGRLIVSTGDAHIYGDQFDAVKTVLAREPKELPLLWLNPEVKNIFDFKHEDIEIHCYESHPAVVVPVAV